MAERESSLSPVDAIQIGDFVPTASMRKPVGDGKFGIVYRATSKDGEDVAAKRIEKSNTDKDCLNDLKALYQIPRDHDNIIRIYGREWDSFGDLWIIMEFCTYGNLNKYYQEYRDRFTDFDSKLDIMCQIVNGLDYLHENKTIHRNMKPSNILVTSDLRQPDCHIIKITDFTATKYLDSDPSRRSTMSTDFCPDSCFKAPEFFFQQGPQNRIRYKKNIDVYATGLMFLAMLQPLEDGCLVPRVEGGQLEQIEAHMPIGQIMYTRIQQEKLPIQLGEEKVQYSHDENMVRRVIRWATFAEPTFRISVNDMKIYMNQIKEAPGVELRGP